MIEEIRASRGLPENLSTEAQLWDEIMKKEAFLMPESLFPLIKELHGKEYPRTAVIRPLATEYAVERADTKEITSIRADITVLVPDSLSCMVEFQDGSRHEYRMPQSGKNPGRKIPPGELTEFHREIILILEQEVKDGYLTENNRKTILSLLGKSMIRVFYREESLLEEVLTLTEPILELEFEKAERLEREVEQLKREWKEKVDEEEAVGNRRLLLIIQ